MCAIEFFFGHFERHRTQPRSFTTVRPGNIRDRVVDKADNCFHPFSILRVCENGASARLQLWFSAPGEVEAKGLAVELEHGVSTNLELKSKLPPIILDPPESGGIRRVVRRPEDLRARQGFDWTTSGMDLSHGSTDWYRHLPSLSRSAQFFVLN